MIDGLRLTCLATVLALSTLPIFVSAGDEDQEPAYMIYIDPETGKYTTEDPNADATANGHVMPGTESENGQSLRLLLILAGAAVVVLLIGGRLKHQQRQTT